MTLDIYDRNFLLAVIKSCQTVDHLNICFEWIIGLGNSEIITPMHLESITNYMTHKYKVLREKAGPRTDPTVS